MYCLASVQILALYRGDKLFVLKLGGILKRVELGDSSTAIDKIKTRRHADYDVRKSGLVPLPCCGEEF